MIIVRVELLSAVDGRKQELARMHIGNEGGDANFGDYGAYVLRGRDAAALDASWRGKVYTRTGKVKHHARQAEHVWNLVGKALAACGYKTV